MGKVLIFPGASSPEAASSTDQPVLSLAPRPPTPEESFREDLLLEAERYAPWGKDSFFASFHDLLLNPSDLGVNDEPSQNRLPAAWQAQQDAQTCELHKAVGDTFENIGTVLGEAMLSKSGGVSWIRNQSPLAATLEDGTGLVVDAVDDDKFVTITHRHPQAPVIILHHQTFRGSAHRQYALSVGSAVSKKAHHNSRNKSLVEYNIRSGELLGEVLEHCQGLLGHLLANYIQVQ